VSVSRGIFVLLPLLMGCECAQGNRDEYEVIPGHALSMDDELALKQMGMVAGIAKLGCAGLFVDVLVKSMVVDMCSRVSPRTIRALAWRLLVARKTFGSKMFDDEEINQRMEFVECGEVILLDGTLLFYSFADDKWTNHRTK
jgi:hypothetical protein